MSLFRIVDRDGEMLADADTLDGVTEVVRNAPVTQGQRPLKGCSGKDFQQELFVPTTTAAFHGEARAVGMLLQE